MGSPSAWKYLILGIILFGCAWYTHSDLTEFEATGGTRRMHTLLVWLYEAGGKWSITMFNLLISSVITMVGIRKFLKPE